MPNGLSARTRRAWKSWWESPVAAMWTRDQWATVEQLARSFDEWDRDILNVKVAAIVLRMLDTLGLTEKGRRALRWRFPHEVPGVIVGKVDVAGLVPDELEKRRDRVKKKRAKE